MTDAGQTVTHAPTGAAPTPDAVLFDRYQSGHDNEAFAELAQRHGPMVLRVCRSVLDHDADAEDAVQAAFLVLAKRPRRIRSGGALASWLHGVALRTAWRMRRSLARQRAAEARTPTRPPASPVDLTFRDALAILDEELDHLPDHHRAPLVLCYLEGRTHDEAAAALGWPLTVFRGHLDRAATKLRARLLRRGVTASAALLAMAAAMSGPASGATFAVAAGRGGTSAVAAGVAGLARAVSSHLARAAIAKAIAALLAVVAIGAGALWLSAEAHPRLPKSAEPSGAGGGPLSGMILAAQFDHFVTVAEDGSGTAAWGEALEEGEFIFGGVTLTVPPRWRISPDGARVTGLSFDPAGRLQVYAAKVGGAGLRQVTHESAHIQRLGGWSPDGTRIYYLASRLPPVPKEGDAYEDFYATGREDGTGRVELLKRPGHFGPGGVPFLKDMLGPIDWR